MTPLFAKKYISSLFNPELVNLIFNTSGSFKKQLKVKFESPFKFIESSTISEFLIDLERTIVPFFSPLICSEFASIYQLLYTN